MRTIIPKNAKLVPANAERVFKGQIFDVYQWPQKMFDDSIETFEMIKRTDTVKILAIRDDKIVVLNEEQPTQPMFIDIPSGRHEHEDETELQAAQRELLEETGMKFSNWRLIGVEQPHSKIDWFVYMYLATGFESQTEQKLDPGEKITVHLKGLSELKNLLNDPKNRYLPKAILERVNTIEDLKNYPEYTGIKL